jgi:hypothetical protein
LVSSQPPFAASLSPPLSAPRPLGDSAASVRDAFGILAMADLMQASFCSFGLAKRLVSDFIPFFADGIKKHRRSEKFCVSLICCSFPAAH